ncbi:Transient receptor putative cation channel sub A member 1 [Nowakowskiella sp. JEL0407]|nr:Transient receptor putative cation channel sub A member 1 [Nowakowskiella sp. JEL0407]
MHLACFSGHLNAVKILLAYGADPFLKNNEGESPFFCAALEARFAVLQTILNGVSDDMQDDIRKTTLARFANAEMNSKPNQKTFQACKLNRETLVNAINQTDAMGDSPLHVLVEDDDQNVIVEYLLSMGANTNIQNDVGDTALHLGIQHSAIANAISILHYDHPDLNIRNMKGKLARDFIPNDFGETHLLFRAINRSS